MSKIDLLLHPIRIRIVMALAGKPLPPGQIAAEIPDVPQTSLYRHINALLEGGILTVVDERPVRGTVEKIYALVEGAARLNQQDIANVSAEEHLRYFMVYLSSLLQDFSNYLDKREGESILLTDLIYNKVRLYLTDEEYQSLTAQVRDIVTPYITRSADGDDAADARKRYIFALMSIPED